MKKLYVVFQGLISLVEFDDYFVGYAVDMPEHRAAAGHWLCETQMPQKELLKLNITIAKDAPASGLDPSINLILPGVDMTRPAVRRLSYCQILLPKPQVVRSYYTASVPAGAVKKGMGFAGQPPGAATYVYSGIQVFEYWLDDNSFANLNSQSLPFFWTASFFDTDEGPMDVLQIFAAPEVSPADPYHHMTEFNRGTELLGAGQVQVASFKTTTRQAYRNVPGYSGVYMAKGMLCEEISPLETRDSMVNPVIVRRLRGCVPSPIPKPSASVPGPHFSSDICTAPCARSPVKVATVPLFS